MDDLTGGGEVVEALVAEAVAVLPTLVGTLPVCPFDRRSPDYWTTANDKPCHVCGGTEAVDKCRGADLRCLDAAADVIRRLLAEITRLQVALADLVPDVGKMIAEPSRSKGPGDAGEREGADPDTGQSPEGSAPTPPAVTREEIVRVFLRYAVKVNVDEHLNATALGEVIDSLLNLIGAHHGS